MRNPTPAEYARARALIATVAEWLRHPDEIFASVETMQERVSETLDEAKALLGCDAEPF